MTMTGLKLSAICAASWSWRVVEHGVILGSGGPLGVVDDCCVVVAAVDVGGDEAGDLVSWLPEERVLYSGDLVFHGLTPLAMTGSVHGAVRRGCRLQRCPHLQRRPHDHPRLLSRALTCLDPGTGPLQAFRISGGHGSWPGNRRGGGEPVAPETPASTTSTGSPAARGQTNRGPVIRASRIRFARWFRAGAVGRCVALRIAKATLVMVGLQAVGLGMTLFPPR